MRRLLHLLVIAVMVLVVTAAPVLAQEAVPNYSTVKGELDMLAGAMDKTASTVLFTYVPGEGATFVMTVNSNEPEAMRSLLSRTAQFFVPAVTSVPDTERFTFAVRHDIFDEWELILTLTKGDAGNPDAWTWYFSEGE